MSAVSWISRLAENTDEFLKLHDPKAYARAFGIKEPLAFCANEDCVYKCESACPAGEEKKICPNKSLFDYRDGCYYYYGIPYQYFVLKNALSGKYYKVFTVTGRGTGKSAIMNTNRAIMEITTEPYIKSMLFKCSKPMPTKVIVAGNTKDTSLLLRNSIVNTINSNELLDDFVVDKTKTYIRTRSNAEMFFKTVGTDATSIRGFHAEVVKNIVGDSVKCTIIIIFDEACFSRCADAIQGVMTSCLQVGNTFSQIFVTSTPGQKSGEVFEGVTDIPRDGSFDGICRNHFASYHNKYTNLMLLKNYRNKLHNAGMGSIYNREVLGMFESDEGLFFPWYIWEKSIDDSLDLYTYEDIEKFDFQVPGTHYLGIDPNRFRQLETGDFAAYTLVSITSDRKRIRLVSCGKFLMDTEDKFFDRIEVILSKYPNCTVVGDENSWYLKKLKQRFKARNGSNQRVKILESMQLMKMDIIHGILKQPTCREIEDERRCFAPKEDGVSNIPMLDHKGSWGQGFSGDLMRCFSYIFQAIMVDFGISNVVSPVLSSSVDRSPSVFGIDRGGLFGGDIRRTIIKGGKLV